MKTILLLFSLAFLIPLSALATCTTDITDTNQVLPVIRDTEGNPLLTGKRYFILSALSGAGGGVLLANIGDQEEKTCPTAVVKSHNDLDNVCRSRPLLLFALFDGTNCEKSRWKEY